MILIEGMDKPENCMVCPFKDADEDCIFRKEETSKIDNFYKMYLGCPLKEVQG